MQIKNPTKSPIEGVKIKGVMYGIGAEATLENIPEEHARYWQSLHHFLILKKDKVEESKIEMPVPKVEEVAESTEEEPMEVPMAMIEEEPMPEEITKPKSSKKIK